MIICTHCGETQTNGSASFVLNNSRDFWLHICPSHPEERAPCIEITSPPYAKGERVRQVFTNRIGVVRGIIEKPGVSPPLYIVSWLDGGSSFPSSELWLIREFDPDPFFVYEDGRLYAPDDQGVLWSIEPPVALRDTIQNGKYFADRYGVARYIAEKNPDDGSRQSDAAASGSPLVTICSFCDSTIEGEDYIALKRKRGGTTKRAVACSPQCAILLIQGGAL